MHPALSGNGCGDGEAGGLLLFTVYERQLSTRCCVHRALHAALRHPLCLLAGHPVCWGLHRTPEVPGLVPGSAGAGALRISRWEKAGLLSMGSVKPAETAPTSKRLWLDGQPKCFWPRWESSHTST